MNGMCKDCQQSVSSDLVECMQGHFFVEFVKTFSGVLCGVCVCVCVCMCKVFAEYVTGLLCDV